MNLKRKMLSALLAASMLLSVITGPLQASTVTESEANLALGKTVTVSDGGNEVEAQRITDGVIAKDWKYSYRYRSEAEAEDPDDKPYVTIDLGESYNIDTIKYFGVMPPDYPGYYNISHNMVIRISNDPDFEDESTKTVYNTDKNNFFGFGSGTDTESRNTMDGITVSFETTNARYVRYYQHGASQLPTPGENCHPNALTACEIEVYSPDWEAPPSSMIPEGNLAYGASITGSEFNSAGINTEGWVGGYDRSDLSDMVSGSINTDYWKAPKVNSDGDAGEAVYVLVDLKKSKTLNTIKIWNYFKTNVSNRVYLNQVVQLSENGTDWVNVYNSDEEDLTGQDPKNSGETVCEGKLVNGEITGVVAGHDEEYQENSDGSGTTISFSPTQARYIRWWCSGKTDNPGPQMVQIQAYNYRTVSFDCGDEAPKTVKVPNGMSVGMPEDPVSDELGILFDKWTVDEDGGEEWDFTQPVTEDMTLVANWKKVPVHTVTFDSNGGSKVDPVSVTEGLLLERPDNPEKEGFVFAGWKLGNAPYRFNTPVTEDITLTASWVVPSTPDAFVIHAGLLNITLDSYGRVTNLISSLDGTDYYCPGPDEKLRSLVSLVADYTVEEPTSLTYDEESGILSFEFASINATAKIALADKGDYTSLTLTEIDKPESVSIQAVLWGPIKTTITEGGQTVGTAYDDEYAIGMHMLNEKTIGGWPIEYKDHWYTSDLPLVNGYTDPRANRNVYTNTALFTTWGSALQAYTWDYTKDTMRTIMSEKEIPQLLPAMTKPEEQKYAKVEGSSIAIYGTRPDNILNVISNIQIKEGLPHPTIDGEWQKTSIKMAQDFLVFNDAMWGLDVLENDAKMANDAGIQYIYGQYGAGGPWNGDGSFEFNYLFGGSDESVKQMVDKASEYGVYIGTHTLSNLISGGTKYATPSATDALAYAGFAALTRDASASDTTLYVADGHPFSDEVVNASGGRREVRIGEELITYTSCSQVTNNEWKLIGCGRGSNGTAASEHKIGENAYKLWAYYTAPYLGGWSSIEPMTDRMGYVYSDLGVHCMSYDAFEATRMSEYSTLMPGRMMQAVYNKVKEAGAADGFITETSDITSNCWDVQTRISWGESNTPLLLMMNSISYYRQNFGPAMLGWMYDHGNHGGYSEPNLLMNLSMKGGWNAGAGWYVNRDTFKQYPHMPEMLKTWNNAIQKSAFTVGEEYSEELQSAMRNAWTNGRIWTLEETVPDQEWVLQEVNKSNISEKIGDPVTLTATHDIKIDQPENGDIATNVSREYSRAHEGDQITVYEQAFGDCALVPGSLKVTGTNGEECELTPVDGEKGTYTFIMPAEDVTITACFEAQSTADTSALKALYESVKDMVQGNYSDESWAVFEAALTEAKAVLDDAGASQSEVDAAFTALLQARDGLEREVNTELLRTVLKIAEETDTTGCTPSSVRMLEEAMEAGRLLLADENATQQQVDDAVRAIHTALVNLVDKADKTRLAALMEDVKKLTEEKYTQESWNKLSNALADAQAIMENEDAAQQQVDDAYNSLMDAVVNLELVPVDKSNLKVAIDLAKPIVAESERYVTSTIEGLSELLSQAEILYSNSEATQEDVDEMSSMLLTASSQARLKANKVALEALAKRADGIDLRDYTQDSVQRFSAALAKAKNLIADETLSEDDQPLVDEAVKTLQASINGLVKIGTEDSDTSKPEVPPTGDDSSMLMMVLLVGSCAYSMLLLHRKYMRANKTR